MATIRQMKATARAHAGKGASRAVRRAGRVPGVIYGGAEPPFNVSVDHAELKQRIYAGRFLTTLCELDVDGIKQRVIPRDVDDDFVDAVQVRGFERVEEGDAVSLDRPAERPWERERLRG